MKRYPYRLQFGLVLLIVLCSQHIQAQDFLAGLSVNSSFHYGKVWKHTPKLGILTDGTGNAFSVDLGIAKQTDGSKCWHRQFGFPETWLAFKATDYGNHREIGQSFAILPGVGFNFLHRPWMRLQFKVSIGVGVFTRIYDETDNPDNLAIGARVTNVSVFELAAEMRLYRRVWLRFGATYHHTSNGNLAMPNLGLNVPQGHIGLKYWIQDPPEYKKDAPKPEKDHKFRYGIRIGAGMREDRWPGDPQVPMIQTGIWVSRQLSFISEISIGLDGTWNGLARSKYLADSTFTGNLLKHSLQGWVHLGHELHMGNLGIVTQLGIYFWDPRMKYSLIYSRLGLRYHIWDPYPRRPDLHIGFYLRAHDGRADFMELGMGIAF